MDELLALLANPFIWLLFVGNSILLVFIGRTNAKAMNQIVEANAQVSKSNQQVLDIATEQTKTANRALELVVTKVAEKTDSSLDAITEHNLSAQKRHEEVEVFLKTMADTQATQSQTINQQTELMTSQTSIMQDMSRADMSIKTAIDTQVIPILEELREKAKRFEEALAALTSAEQIEQLAELMREIKASLDEYTSSTQTVKEMAIEASSVTILAPAALTSETPAEVPAVSLSETEPVKEELPIP
jgi:hypothetical protein